MRFSTALVACFAAYVSAIDLEAKAEATADLETKAEAKSEFTQDMMEELGAPIVNGTVSTTPSDAQNSDSNKTESATNSSGSTATSASTETTETSASAATETPMATTSITMPTPTVNEQEEAPKVESAKKGLHPHPKNAKAPYDGYFANPYHQKQDYLRPGPDKLPGPDFNKQVYEFNERK